MPNTVHYDLFVSYAAPDRAWVEGYLLDALTHAGVRCHSEAAFALGAPRLLEFERAIQESERTLLVLSPAYLADTFSQFIDLLAQSYGVETATWPVVPLILHPVKLPLRLSMLTALDGIDPSSWPQLVAQLCHVIQRPPPEPVPRPACPYPGMMPFREADHDRFFGRDQEIQDLLGHLRMHPIVAVIGPSGSGKSSLVYAGLLPAIRASGLFGVGAWLVRSLRPGEAPLHALTAALGSDPSENPEQAVRQALTTAGEAQHMLVIVDQFEELFTLAPAERVPFQRTLLRLAQVPQCYVVITVRADFYPDLMATPLWRSIQTHRMEVAPLDEDGLRQAIVRPAEHVGTFLDPALVERLVSDAVGEPGVLPLVQETLVLLWEWLERRYLPLSAYERLIPARSTTGLLGTAGHTGLYAAIARRADGVLDDMTIEQQAIARRIFLRLIQFGEGRADTRRQQSVAALRTVGADPLPFEQTLHHLTNTRLLTLSGEEHDSDRKVDIAHESLIVGWPTLYGWVSERREAEQTRRRLEAKADEWVRLGRGHGGLLDAAELPEAERWLASADAVDLGHDPMLPAFVQASQDALAEAERAKEAARRHELAQTQHYAAEQTRSARRLRRVVGALIIVALLALLTAAFATRQQQQLQTEAYALATEEARAVANANLAGTNEARANTNASNALAAQATAQAEAYARATQEARAFANANLAATNEARAHSSADLAATNEAQARASGNLAATNEAQAQTSANNALAAQATAQAEAYARATQEARALANANLAATNESQAQTSANNALAAQATTQAEAYARATQEARALANANLAATNEAQARSSANDALAAQSSANQSAQNAEARAADARAAQATAVAERDRADQQARMAFSRQVAAQSLQQIDKQFDLALLLSVEANRIADTAEAKGSLLIELEHKPYVTTFLRGQGGQVGWSNVTFSPDGKTLASGSYDGTIILWDMVTHQPSGELITNPANLVDPVDSVAFSPDGKTLASGSYDGTIILWDMVTHQPIGTPLTGHTDGVSSVAFSPDGKTLASGSCISEPFVGCVQGEIRLWDVATRQPLGTPLTGHTREVSSVAFSPDGKVLASSDCAQENPDLASYDKTIILWDVATRRPLGTSLAGYTDGVRSVAFSPDGKTLASGGWDNTITLRDVATRQPLGTPLTGHTNYVRSVAFSPDGKILASGSWDNTIILWDVATRQPIGTPLTEHTNGASSVAFSPDGTTLASGSYDGIILWDVATRQPIGAPLTGHTNGVSSVAFSPDGKILASIGGDQSIRLWDVATHQSLGAILTAYIDRVIGLAFSPDGKILASSGCADFFFPYCERSEVRLWDVATHQPLGVPLTDETNEVSSIAFSPDGKILTSARCINDGGGCDPSDVILWDVARHQPIGAPLTGHTGWVTSVVFSPDGKILASGSGDKTIRLWDVATHQPLGVPLTGHTGGVSSVAFSSDGKTLASGSDDKTIMLWDVSVGSWQARACRIANRNLTKGEWDQFIGADNPYHRTCPGLPPGDGAAP